MHRPVKTLFYSTSLWLALCGFAVGGNTVPMPFAAVSPEEARHPLTTDARRSNFQSTGRYAEVIALCKAFAKTYPKEVRCTEFGRTPEGRPMLALVASRSGALTPSAAHKLGVPVVLVQGGIHAGEIDGKDAGFLALKHALESPAASSTLRHQVLVFVPVFNVDGHERFGAWMRPNQRGPRETGWRTTAQNYNLNRDYAKADSPEMQAMLKLVNAWDPLATIDLHVTDGAQFEHGIAIQVEPVNAGDADLRQVGLALRSAVIGDLEPTGALPLAFYPSFVEEDNPASGFVDGVSAPRFSTGYFLTRNRLAMLVETHSWKSYLQRVRMTYDTVNSVINQVARHGKNWQAVARAADARAQRVSGQMVALDYKTTATTRTVEFRGYAYTRTPSEISGALMTRYDETQPQIWKLPVRDEIVPDLLIKAPAGYWVPAAHAAQIGAKLAQHAITFERVSMPRTGVVVEAFRASKVELDKASFEGHQRPRLQGAWATEKRDITAGSLWVPIAQAKSLLVMHLLEPTAPDALVGWGYFATAFEQKEYLEPYVAEDIAREQLRSNPALALEFKQRLATDATFAASAQARLDFFYRRHASWDERFNLYPVLRVMDATR